MKRCSHSFREGIGGIIANETPVTVSISVRVFSLRRGVAARYL